MEMAGKAFYMGMDYRMSVQRKQRVIKRPELVTPFSPPPQGICALGLASAHGTSACLRLLFAHKLTRSDLEVIITLLLTAGAE